MESKPILITGCQRSGTTLLNLILDSHPTISGIDETYFRDAFDTQKMHSALQRTRRYKHTCFKLPMESHNIASLKKEFPDLKVIWIVRDPRAVIASMITLHIKINPFVSVSWGTSHVHREILNALRVLPDSTYDQLPEYVHRFMTLENVPSVSRKEEDVVFTCAFCWLLKQLTVELHQQNGVPVELIHYEDLTTTPAQTLRKLISGLGIEWHEDLLRHHALHEGVSIGGTRNDQPITPGHISKWTESLATEAIPLISAICGKKAQQYGYTGLY